MKILYRQLAESPRSISIPLSASWLKTQLMRVHPDLEDASNGALVGRGYLTNQGAIIEGRIEFTFTANCARCLAEIDIQVKLPCRWILTNRFDLVQDNPEALSTDGSGRIDLEGPIAEVIDLGVPSVLLCREDCAGLCPRCGADLNSGPCGCQGRNRPAE